MNGPENFREADSIITDERCDYGCPHAGCPHEMAYLARAIVHAIQANTAATLVRSGLTPAGRHEWLKAIDPEYAAGQATGAGAMSGTRNPFVIWLWAALALGHCVMWPVILLAGSWLGYLGWLPWLAVLALLIRWERTHSLKKMYRTWSP